jgi:excinuclease ABC subunit A
MMDHILIKGARTHNLKNVDVKLPRNKLVVITGMSGSGKSSLAFDTIYAEGQRRYVESLSAYARQFLDQMDKPDVDTIEGLSPAVSVEQKSVSHNPRSTVGTVTEIYDYLRLLYARIGTPYCYQCGKLIEKQTVQQATERLLAHNDNNRIHILAPIVDQRKGQFQKELLNLRSRGFVRIKIDGIIYDLAEEITLDKNKKHSLDVVIDRLKVNSENKSRLNEALESAVNLAGGMAKLEFLDDERRVILTELMSINNACIDCGISYPKIEPQLFSFNSPQGACNQCDGLGELMHVDETLVVPNDRLSINAGAIVPWFGKKTNYYQYLLESLAKHYKFNLDTPFHKLPKKIKDIVFGGSPDFITIQTSKQKYQGFFEGLKSNLMRRYKETESSWMRSEIAKFMSSQDCPACHGARLKKESLFIKVAELNVSELTAKSISEISKVFVGLKLTAKQSKIAHLIIKEITSRIGFLLNVGLNYLSLDRKSHTLSGGEAQRIRLATQIGSALVGVTYVLDEPSIGLHQRDNEKLIQSLTNLRDVGNTVIVVEHDEETILGADYVLDLGPKAGVHGGEVVFAGTVKGLLKCKKSLTGAYLNGRIIINLPKKRRKGNGELIRIKGASENNLKTINADFPLGKFICITGVSGSGKSTLINDTLYPLLKQELYGSRTRIGKNKGFVCGDIVDKVINIDQSPIGRTPRSNPATYTQVFTHIRDLFSSTLEAKARGYKPGRFSFNVRGGRCDTCDGDGLIRIEMHFLPDVFVKCEACQGKRFNDETLAIHYKGKNIADVLKMTVEEALEFFQNIPSVKKKLATLHRVGLDYIELGQFATTLSGGEAQRIKLSRELAKRSTGKTLYILDEPTTGLHFEDVKMLLNVLSELVDQGNTVLVIEHNLHVVKTADHIIDLGPEGGKEGGQIVAEGTPEAVAKNRKSHTGKYLIPLLK